VPAKLKQLIDLFESGKLMLTEDLEIPFDAPSFTFKNKTSDGGGSSGGKTNHLSGYLGGSVGQRTIFLNLDEIPEFTDLTLFVLIIASTIILIIIKKRLPPKNL
jgi:hypothetical protein